METLRTLPGDDVRQIMGLAGLTGGRLCWPAASKPTHQRIPSIEDYYRGRISPATIEAVRQEATAKGQSLHDALMMAPWGGSMARPSHRW